MADVLTELVDLLLLERLEENLFRGRSQDLGWGTVFGGQVLGQGLSAAAQTVPGERQVHSLHAYFLRPGDVTKPVVYEVERIRDGTSFTTRTVVALQEGRAIFNLAASFQTKESGLSRQDSVPSSPPPETLPTEDDQLAPYLDRLPLLQGRAWGVRAFEIRYAAETDDPFHPSAKPARRHLWFRAAGKMHDDDAVHRQLLAYVSDYSFLTTALLPHEVTVFTPGMQVASLDHAMWFHQPFRVDEWLLHVIESPVASGARALVRGHIYRRDGRLVASTAQEGLMRQRTR